MQSMQRVLPAEEVVELHGCLVAVMTDFFAMQKGWNGDTKRIQNLRK